MTRHLCSLCALLFLLPAAAQAQGAISSYDVPVGGRDNTIILTIANESTNETAQALQVQLVRQPENVSFASSLQTVEQLGPGKESDCAFHFQVKRSAVPMASDTLRFLVTDKIFNLTWQKTVILRYSGPSEFRLQQNYPNPFNPTTTIAFDLPDDAHVRIVVYDMLGREVKVLLDDERKVGCYDVKFDAAGIASGVYFYRMTAEPLGGDKPFSQVKRLLVVR